MSTSSSQWSLSTAIEHRGFKKFFRQDDATAYVREHGSMMFSSDVKPNDGLKSFGCSGYKEFFRHYSRMPASQRCLYEIVLEHVPCCLHIDCDLDETFNRDSPFTGEQRLEAGMRIIRRMLKSLFGIEQFVEIVCDSSNADKFSRHIKIAFLDGSMMADNYHCGAFMRRVELEMYAEHNGYLNSPHYAWSNEDRTNPKRGLKPVIDLSIYTKNR